ncbi:MAG: hypothetical protein P1V36_00380 [Planctomycetota bacterium]|nr:hypothetical protein [Planctomycetota bacterium]
MSDENVSAEEARGLLAALSPNERWCATPAEYRDRECMASAVRRWAENDLRPSRQGGEIDLWAVFNSHGASFPVGGQAASLLAAAAPDLARTVIARTEEVDALRARAEKAEAERDEARRERGRLARILAVERGDESQAPDGWRVGASGWFAYGEDPGQCDREVMREDLTEPWLWVVYSDEGPAIKQGPAPSALQAMEAADAARGEVADGQ